jgi:hypothetical protein
VRNAVVFAVDVKTFQVGVRPTHGDLNGVMEVGDGVVAAQEQSATDHRADAAQGDLELVNAWRLRIRHWSPIVSLRVFPNQPSVSSSAAPAFLCSPISVRKGEEMPTFLDNSLKDRSALSRNS